MGRPGVVESTTEPKTGCARTGNASQAAGQFSGFSGWDFDEILRNLRDLREGCHKDTNEVARWAD